MRIAGDPLEHDIIICFGNESVHWYSVLIDNRIGKKKVIIINFPLHTLCFTYFKRIGYFSCQIRVIYFCNSFYSNLGIKLSTGGIFRFRLV